MRRLADGFPALRTASLYIFCLRLCYTIPEPAPLHLSYEPLMKSLPTPYWNAPSQNRNTWAATALRINAIPKPIVVLITTLVAITHNAVQRCLAGNDVRGQSRWVRQTDLEE